MENAKREIGELIRFIIVGFINTLVGSGVMFLAFNLFRLDYWVSSALNYVIGSICSYLLNKYFTFKSNRRSAKEIFSFIVNILICYIVAYGLARPLSRAVFSSLAQNIQDNIALFTGMVVFTGLNYIGQKFFVFRKEVKDEE